MKTWKKLHKEINKVNRTQMGHHGKLLVLICDEIDKLKEPRVFVTPVLNDGNVVNLHEVPINMSIDGKMSNMVLKHYVNSVGDKVCRTSIASESEEHVHMMAFCPLCGKKLDYFNNDIDNSM